MPYAVSVPRTPYSPPASDDDLVAHDKGRHRDRFTRRIISVLDLPDLVAGLRVERDDMVVERRHEQLAIGVGRAAVDEIAAGHRNRVLIGVCVVLPLDLARTIEVDGVDDERLRRLEVEHAVDDEWAAFVSAQDAGRDLPADLQILDVAPIDLIERRVAPASVVSRLHRPIGRIPLKSVQLTGDRSWG
jgi:hypothetical protein